MCNDGAVPAVILAMVGGLVRRVRPMSVAFALYETWRHLPPDQRERILAAAKRNAPRVAATIARRSRPPT